MRLYLVDDFSTESDAKLKEFFSGRKHKRYSSYFEVIKKWLADDGPVGRLVKPLVKQDEFLM